jgi:hypothetical protein
MKEFCIDLSGVTVSDERDLLVQQIDMLFDTNPTEVFGDEYGADFYNLLWDLGLSNDDISNYTKSVIYGNINLLGWELDVSTELLQGTLNDIILIKVQLSKYDEVFEKIYKIE